MNRNEAKVFLRLVTIIEQKNLQIEDFYKMEAINIKKNSELELKEVQLKLLSMKNKIEDQLCDIAKEINETPYLSESLKSKAQKVNEWYCLKKVELND